METKHTPGPWTVTDLGDIEAKETHICQINQSMLNNKYPELTTHLEAQANAKLIASAPELLEELQQIDKILDDFVSDQKLTGEKALELIITARNKGVAIKKATE